MLAAKKSMAGVAIGMLTLCSSQAADWNAYRGPTQNGISQESGWVISESGAPELWRKQVGTGTSSVVVSGGRVYTMGHEGGQDVVVCLEAASGREIWRHAYKVSLDPNLFEGGPRSTPTVDGEFVYVVSHEGHLICLNAAKGQVVWQRHLVSDFAGRKPEWGFSGAPLVKGGVLFVESGSEGGSTLALNPKTGERIWGSGSDKLGYSSPCIFQVDGVSALLTFKAEALVACDPGTGRELWRFPWKTSYDINAASPIMLGENRVLISSGYGTGCALIQIENGHPKLIWKNKNLQAHINSPVLVNGAIFGVDGNTGGGNLVCLDPVSGERNWVEKSVKGGALTVAGGKLLVVSEKGDFLVVEADPSGFRQISRQSVFSKRTWAQPVLSDGRVFLRDNLGAVACLDLRSRK